MKDWNWEEIPCLAVNGSQKESADFLKNLYNKLITEYSSEQMKISIISSSVDFAIDKKYLYAEPVINQNYVADLLIKLNQEISYRYQTFSSAGVKNIKEYNADKITMPYIFVFIDDLMKLSESIDQISLIRSRAAGIYTIGCTENYSELPMILRSDFQVENIQKRRQFMNSKEYNAKVWNKIHEEVEASKKYNLEDEPLSDGITLVKLTKDNVAKVESIIRTDSNYSSFKEANYDNDKYSPYWIREMGKHLGQITDEEKKEPDFETIVENVIEKIDKENGTHLKATFEDERTTAVHVMKDRIIKIKDTLLNYLKDPNYKNGDKTLIGILSEKTNLKNNGNRRHLSFASKFCHYSCYHLFSGKKEQDNYSIYDRYVREALPFYLKKYGINNIQITDKSTYKEYQQAIDAILDKADEKISRNGFDHLVWYYFKGGRLQAEKAAFKKKEK